MSIDLILYIVAAVLFACDGIGLAGWGRLSRTPLGLLALTISLLV